MADTRSKERPKHEIVKTLDWIVRSQESTVGCNVLSRRCEEEDETKTGCPERRVVLIKKHIDKMFECKVVRNH